MLLLEQALDLAVLVPAAKLQLELMQDLAPSERDLELTLAQMLVPDR